MLGKHGICDMKRGRQIVAVLRIEDKEMREMRVCAKKSPPYPAILAVRAIASLIRKTHRMDWLGVPAEGLGYDGPELTHPSVTGTNSAIRDSLGVADFDESIENQVDPLQHLLLRCYQLGFNSCAEMYDVHGDGTNERVYHEGT